MVMATLGVFNNQIDNLVFIFLVKLHLINVRFLMSQGNILFTLIHEDYPTLS